MITNSSNGISQVLRKAVYVYGTRNVLTGLRSFPLAPSSFVLKHVLKKKIFCPIQGRAWLLCFHVIAHSEEYSHSLPFTFLCQGPGEEPGKVVLISFAVLKEREDKACAVLSVWKLFIWFLACLCSNMNWTVNKWEQLLVGAKIAEQWNAPNGPHSRLPSPWILLSSILFSPEIETDRGHCILYQCQVLATSSGVVAAQESQWE